MTNYPKQIFFIVLLAVVPLLWQSCQPAATQQTQENPVLTAAERRQQERTGNSEMEANIDHVLAEMTLEEKVGQMMQINNTQYAKKYKAAASESAPPDVQVSIDTAKLINYLKNYHVGTFLNGVAVTPETWFAYSQQLQELNMRFSRLNIPIIYGIDHMHGANYVEGSTIFPHSINIGATFNTQFSTDEGQVVGTETADLGHHWIFGPVLDLARNPYWPRFYETYGEDPHLVAEMGAAYVKALQKNPGTAPYKQAATAKHFIGYSDPDNGWDRTPATIDDQQLYEFHVPAFQAAVDAGIKTFMINGGEINGVPVHASDKLLTRLLRDQMGFTGVVVTDWQDVIRLYKSHKVAEDMKDATYQAVMAGIDISMTPYETDFFDVLVELVNEDKISMDRIDLSVARILRLKYDLGLFENPYPRNDRFERVGAEAHRQKALAAARESIVLLKNDGTLPLQNPGNIVLAGMNADSKKGLAGGWTLRWIPYDEGLFPEDMHTVYTAMQQEFKDANISLATRDDIAQKSRAADAIVIATGELPYAETPGNIVDLTLDAEELALIEAARATGKPVILMMIAGRPRIIPDVLNRVDAFIWAGLPGFEGGQAIAEILSGQVNPSGKLPFTYPAYPGHWHPYNYKSMETFFSESEKEAFRNSIANFGDGLSYTTFEYSDLSLASESVSGSETLVASVQVTNTGNRPGKEAVLWFISDEVGSITRPVKALKHFEKQELQPGETATFTFNISPVDALAFPDENGKMLLEPGQFTLQAGGLSAGFSYSEQDQ